MMARGTEGCARGDGPDAFGALGPHGGVRDVSGAYGVRGAPGATDAFGVRDVSGAYGVRGAPGAPDAYGARGAPETHGVPDAHGASGAPDAYRAPDAWDGAGGDGGTAWSGDGGTAWSGDGGTAGSGDGGTAGSGSSRSSGAAGDRGPERERRARAALSRVLEPGDARAGGWLRECGPVELMRRITVRDGSAERLPGMTARRLAGYRLRAETARPDQDLAALASAGGRFVCPGDREWPSQLEDLGDAAPTGLWVRGTPDLRLWALRSVAVVGARACTPYGAHMAATLAAGLAERGWVVVSGAAFGVDGAAHRGALAAGGATVAVLACGVDVPYPRGHTELIGRVADQGLVISELPPGDHPTRGRFVLRNRVIAALTRGTVVVEAEHRSGSLVTARRARQLGRFTMGVPGPATSGLSAGVHELLRGEAVLVTDADEIVELVGDIGELAPARRGPLLPRDQLDPVGRRVLDALPGRGEADAREVARGAGTSADEALGKLYELHSLGFVEREGEGWRLTRRPTRNGDARRGGT